MRDEGTEVEGFGKEIDGKGVMQVRLDEDREGGRISVGGTEMEGLNKGTDGKEVMQVR